IVFARSSSFAERLGVLALRQGGLTADQFDKAADHARAHGTRIGVALLDLGMITGSALFNLHAFQLAMQVAAACNGPEVRARFTCDRSPIESATILRLPPMAAVVDATDRAAVRFEPFADRPIAPVEGAHAVVREWQREI